MTTCMFFYPLFLIENNVPDIYVSLQVGHFSNDQGGILIALPVDALVALTNGAKISSGN